MNYTYSAIGYQNMLDMGWYQIPDDVLRHRAFCCWGAAINRGLVLC